MLRTSLVLLSLILSSLMRHQRFSRFFCFFLKRSTSPSVGGRDIESRSCGVALGNDELPSGRGADVGALRRRREEDIDKDDLEEREEDEEVG